MQLRSPGRPAHPETSRHPTRRPVRHSTRGGIISKLIFLIFLVILVGLVYVARHPLLRLAGRVWIDDDAPQRSDVIVVLGGDNYEADRAARAAELFKAGWAPTVVASGRFLRSYASSADLTERDLTERGVPTQDIVQLTHRAENTSEEIEVIYRLAAQKYWKKILIVTSNYHTRRTKMICERLFPVKMEVRVIAAPDADYDPDSWWRSRLGVKLFFHETIGYVVALWEVRRAAASTSAVMMTPSHGALGRAAADRN